MSKIPSRLQSGFSLIEVLISLLILGVGMLGLGGLQVTALKSSGNAHSRTVASMLILDLSDRMRANPLGVEGGFYDDAVDCGDAEKQCRISTHCTFEETAKFDVQEIMCGMKRGTKREGGVANFLPSSSLQISCPTGCATAPNTRHALHNITIAWGERSTHQLQESDENQQTLVVPIIP